jgi:hypothetical protein
MKARVEEEVHGRVAFLKDRAGKVQAILSGIMDKRDLR